MRKLIYFLMMISMVVLSTIPFLPNQSLSYEEVVSQITALEMENMTIQNMNTCKKNFDFKNLNKDDFLYYLNEDAMDVDELLLVRTTAMGSDEIVTKMQHRIDTQKSKFEGYGVIQMEKLNQAKIIPLDDCVLLIISNQDTYLSLGGSL